MGNWPPALLDWPARRGCRLDCADAVISGQAASQEDTRYYFERGREAETMPFH